jgi:hypothetical protein
MVHSQYPDDNYSTNKRSGDPKMSMGVQEAEVPTVTEPVSVVPDASTTVAAARTVLQLDTTHKYVANIPVDSDRIAGYDTGSSDIKWTEDDWKRFPHSKQIHINQDPSSDPLLGNVFDIEGGAWTIDGAVAAAKTREDHGREINIYISYGALGSLRNALALAKIKSANIWAADWNLSLEEATNLIETSGDYPLVCVQWASPSSNPLMIVPGSTLTLAEANVDISVALATWLAENDAPKVVDPTPVKPPATMTATLEIPDGLEMTSSDGGKTWTISGI